VKKSFKLKFKAPKVRLPVANKPNTTHKDKSKYQRMTNRNLVQDAIEELDYENEDDFDEVEDRLISLCIQAEDLDPTYNCTCPNPESELALDHIDYLIKLIAESV